MEDRLLELICESMQTDECISHCNHPYCDICKNIARRLLEDNWVRLSCRVGDILWFNTYKNNATVCVGVQPHKIDRIDTYFVCNTDKLIETKIPDWEIGKTVFHSKEETEAALRNENR